MSPGSKLTEGLAQSWREVGLLTLTVEGIALLAYPIAHGCPPLQHTAAAILTAGAAGLLGFLIGFLFGMPVSEPDSSRPKPAPPPDGMVPAEAGTEPKASGSNDLRFRPNNSLQQVSDWFTKLLLGAGLVQLGNFYHIGDYLKDFVGSAHAAVIIVIFFAGSGFLYGYLLTILCLAPLVLDIISSAFSKTLQAMQEETSAKVEQAAVESDMFNALYRPGEGYKQAIFRGEEAIARGKAASADMYGYLAAAYGQKYHYEGLHASPVTQAEIRGKALAYAKKAVELEPSWRETLKGLYEASDDDAENDWSDFRKPGHDPELELKKFLEGNL